MPTTTTPAPREPVTSDTAARLRLAIARLARFMRQQNQGGFSQNLTSALAALDTQGPLTLGELATVEQIAPPSITKIVEKLEHLGYVERTQDPGDRRVHRVAVTPAGHEQLERTRTLLTAWLAERLETLRPDERDQIATVLRILEHLAAPPDRGETGRANDGETAS